MFDGRDGIVGIQRAFCYAQGMKDFGEDGGGRAFPARGVEVSRRAEEMTTADQSGDFAEDFGGKVGKAEAGPAVAALHLCDRYPGHASSTIDPKPWADNSIGKVSKVTRMNGSA
ncbi:MAG TPA: hypothetical protein VFE51_18255 [Verrucomicrobiae bacterium]|nr:hypothetical protein [Verrucomicrobiae bacterium]